jgi:hypothetical protein
MLSKNIEEKIRQPFKKKILNKLNVMTYLDLLEIINNMSNENKQEYVLLGDYYVTKNFQQFHALDLEYVVDEEIIKSN